jgi:predicted esterase
MLEQAGAEVDHHTLPSGHQLSQYDVDLASQWLLRQQGLLA